MTELLTIAAIATSAASILGIAGLWSYVADLYYDAIRTGKPIDAKARKNLKKRCDLANANEELISAAPRHPPRPQWPAWVSRSGCGESSSRRPQGGPLGNAPRCCTELMNWPCNQASSVMTSVAARPLIFAL